MSFTCCDELALHMNRNIHASMGEVVLKLARRVCSTLTCYLTYFNFILQKNETTAWKIKKDIISKHSYRTRQSKKKSSRVSFVGINGKIDPPSEYDEVDEEVIYSQESPNMVEVYRDFDWELDRFVEYRFPIKKPL